MTKDEFCSRLRKITDELHFDLSIWIAEGENEQEIDLEDEVVIELKKLIGEVDAKDSKPNRATG